ncbi:hypothetical protein J9260_14075 [Thiothrix unzii]|uniref:Uncharacterized protein n=1 Tax=Thiothrix unzii TaxID=111769 RepID=A0A975IGM1_9GAMM|nr:hypothetical protein J9260_14075 [Thiothrix unzii]
MTNTIWMGVLLVLMILLTKKLKLTYWWLKPVFKKGLNMDMARLSRGLELLRKAMGTS